MRSRKRFDAWPSLLRWAAVALLCLFPAANAAAAAEELAGWESARWGMTRAELATAFGDRVTALARPLDYGKFVARDMIREVRIAGRPFVALLQLDRRSDRLAQVLLRFPGRFPTFADYRAVRLALEAELGSPARVRPETDYSGTFAAASIEVDWRLAKTHVRLRYTDAHGGVYRLQRKELIVRYYPAPVR
jgi:hypothetical protein